MTIIDKIKRIYQEQKSILDGTSTAVPNTWLIHHSELSSCGTYDYFPTTEWKLGHPRLYLEVLSKAAYKVGLDDLIRSESEIMGHPGEYETEAKDYEIKEIAEGLGIGPVIGRRMICTGKDDLTYLITSVLASGKYDKDLIGFRNYTRYDAEQKGE